MDCGVPRPLDKILHSASALIKAEVAIQLSDIFLLLDVPVILQSNNDSEFTAQIITELRSLCPELSIVHTSHDNHIAKALLNKEMMT